MNRCYLALGSNLRCPERQLRQALHALRTLPRTWVTRQSSLYHTRPLGLRTQPAFCNMVIELATTLPVKQMLNHCQAIERQFQRAYRKHWGPRTLDIDMLLYGNLTLQTPRLTLPHPHMLQRDFVLVPLLEINQAVCMPNGQLFSHYLDSCTRYIIR